MPVTPEVVKLGKLACELGTTPGGNEDSRVPELVDGEVLGEL